MKTANHSSSLQIQRNNLAVIGCFHAALLCPALHDVPCIFIMDANTNTVLYPEIVNVKGRCYRFPDSIAWSQERGAGAYQEEPLYADDNYDVEMDDHNGEINITSLDNGEFTHAFYVPKVFFPILTGTKGSVRKRLEAETKTTIRIPKQGQDGDIVVVGYEREKVRLAKRKIDDLVKSSWKKLRYTHFLSIPLNDRSIVESFNTFKQQVLAVDPLPRGVDEKIFQIPEKLHLTIGMLVLVDDTDRARAVKELEMCKKSVICPLLNKTGPLQIMLEGIDYMNDDPAEVAVLYAKVKNPDVLEVLSDKIVDHFEATGLLRKDHDKVKMHATLMNVKFQEEVSGSWRQKNYRRFDATNILKQHADTVFGKQTLDTIHISQLHSIGKDGYYTCTARISL